MGITIIHTYYNQPKKLLQQHFKEWKKFAHKDVEFIIIDDCSLIPLHAQINKLVDKLNIYRILDDIKWNQGGARNLGFYMANNDWVFCSDIDHIVTEETFNALETLDKGNIDIYYPINRKDKNGNLIEGDTFDRLNSITGGGFLIHRNSFFSIGGYDEDFSGNYGMEDMYFKAILHKKIIPVYQEDIYTMVETNLSTPKLLRDSTINRVLLDKKIENIQPNNNILRFKWEKCT